MSLDFIFSIIILIFSVVVHEVSHGFTAYKLGDNTAKYQGRLTLNPLKHLEWFGSFILPIITYVSGGFILGWAKPVPYNPYNLSNQKWGEALVALAGPLSNIFIAIIFGILVRFDGLGILSGLARYLRKPRKAMRW
jgi:Zn-dependent protease